MRLEISGRRVKPWRPHRPPPLKIWFFWEGESSFEVRGEEVHEPVRARFLVNIHACWLDVASVPHLCFAAGGQFWMFESVTIG